MTVVYLGLGSNLGDREANLKRALELLGSRMKVLEVSSVYETEPVGSVAQPLFLNAVCRVDTDLEPQELLRFVKAIEAQLGRKTDVRHGPREMDIDILLYDDVVLDTGDLVVPHPRMSQRAFVLVPLAEIAPGVRHPVLGQTALEMLSQVGLAGVVLWRGGEKQLSRHKVEG